MHENDRALASALRQTQVDFGAPSFAKVFAAAEEQIRSRRRMKFAAAGMAAIVALVVFTLPPAIQNDDFIYVDREELLASTRWSAPSDSLLPTREWDIYQEIPRLFESTEPDGGALL